MSETRVFQTETRPRREVSTSRETENETRREIKQFDLNTIPTLTMSETRLFLSLLLSLSFSLYLSLSHILFISFLLSLTFYLSLSFSLSLFPITSCSIKMKKKPSNYIYLSLVLLLARIYYFSLLTRSSISHEKRERDEISLMVKICK